MEDLKNIISNLSFLNKEITHDTDLLEDLGFDSLQILRLLVEVENHYNFQISYDAIDYEIFKRYQDLEQFVIKKIEKSDSKYI
ncbi:acyl carrier protein [Paenibacillus tundrae]|uniref:Acyl carrier protein n=1 Tax=Paenibacillus tundrae TaxID=528187 RepID=A0ABT9WJB4_9BACL|nr:acyl carrier protein [Paenibacillus tundrae]MDQ0173379.1 acyl carrier protein [Paenibacillus tundrae]